MPQLRMEKKNLYARIKSRAVVLRVFVLAADLGIRFSFAM